MPLPNFNRHLIVALRFIALPLVLAIVPVFAIYAHSQIKEIVERFLGDCLFVAEKTERGGHVLVTAKLSGIPPKTLPLVFEGRDALINTILFEDAYREGLDDDPSDLAFHPMTGSVCPGALCQDAGPSPDRAMFPITLTDLSKDFAYRFRVRLRPLNTSEAVAVGHLKVYAIFDHGLSDGVCRVQPRRWTNFWVWASPLQKFLMLAVVIVVSSFLIRFAGGKT